MAEYQAYLVTLNEDEEKGKHWDRRDLAQKVELTKLGELADEWWNVANRSITRGDRLFILRQGKSPKGLMGAGRCVSESPYPSDHYNKEKQALGQKAWYVDARWDTLLHPEEEQLFCESVVLDVLRDDGIEPRGPRWHPRNSGIGIGAKAAEQLETLWEAHVETVRGYRPATRLEGELDEEDFPEGPEIWRLHRSFERNQRLIQRCKTAALEGGKKLICTVCDFDFFATYGEIGKGFIECHHLIPLHELPSLRRTRVEDMALVCSNCHRMLHRRRPCLQLSVLRQLRNGLDP